MNRVNKAYSDGFLGLSEGNVVLTKESDHGLAKVGRGDVAIGVAKGLELLAELLQRGGVEDISVLAMEINPGLGRLKVELTRANGLVVMSAADVHAMGLEIGLTLRT